MITLPANTLDLFWVKLDQPDRLRAECYALLTSLEKEQVQRFVFEKDRRRGAISRGVLRVILAEYLNVSPVELEFETAERGKPYLKLSSSEPRIFFNLSHSGERMLLGVSREGEVGVDVESVRPMENCLELAERFFAASEQTLLQQSEVEKQNLLFFRIWTCKEAYLKAQGVGLPGGLSSFSVDPGLSGNVLSPESDSTLDWYLDEIEVESNYLSAYCCQKKPGLIRLCHYQPGAPVQLNNVV